MLWIGLYLPELSVQIAERGAAQPGPALVIKEGPEQRPRVVAANAQAQRSGVHAGMAVAAAQALLGDLLILPRKLDAEQAALRQLACWAGQFTPAIIVEPGQGLLLEVSASLRLFKGLENLLCDIRQGLHELGYRASCGVAPTAGAAWLLAQARAAGHIARGCRRLAELSDCLDALPLVHCPWSAERLAMLHTLGIKRLGQVRALPRPELARRFGPGLLNYLDQVYGRLPDPRPFYTPPERYRARSEFMQEVFAVEALLFSLKRLLLELEGFLRARDAGVQRFVLGFEHDDRRHAPTRLSVGLLAPERAAARLLMLARERLEQNPPGAPVIAITVEADELLPYAPDSQSLLPDTRRQALDWRQLRERLQARLGEDKLFVLQPGDDHRPELATLLAADTRKVKKAARKAAPLDYPLRPCWLLPEPRPLAVRADQPQYQGPLRLLAGPERLETGWWDGRRVNRDYYVARNAAGETLWIYREHRAPRGWFLHGLFA
jgi:protein ImuB